MGFQSSYSIPEFIDPHSTPNEIVYDAFSPPS
ncbi:hypothetical protein T05_1931 [Trichinella murrelli]|uniref:Uncharacterized protein n=1 Tax=Trichinella murrelli TaxID=144512 RepID=A0A0V0SPY6_9BILA|nr:hypothetical protein T05_9489 [Trichinella murrelli]KRX31278.1 hypothetical protein T05_1931 [Trichinella murrelli]